MGFYGYSNGTVTKNESGSFEINESDYLDSDKFICEVDGSDLQNGLNKCLIGKNIKYWALEKECDNSCKNDVKSQISGKIPPLY